MRRTRQTYQAAKYMNIFVLGGAIGQHRFGLALFAAAGLIFCICGLHGLAQTTAKTQLM